MIPPLPDEITAALRAMVKAYGPLHDRVSDLIEDGRFTEIAFPDDYDWLADQLAEPCNAAIHRAETLLKQCPLSLPPHPPNP